MMDFDRWFQNVGRAPTPVKPKIVIHPELVDLFNPPKGYYEYRCRSCDNYTEVYEPEEHMFDPDMHYCGGSPYCLP